MSQREIQHAPGFYLHMSGGGEGCDYTIGCGHKFMRLDADTLEKARVAAMTEWHDHGAESRCDAMHILTVSHVEDLAGLMSADREQRDAEKAAAALASKRAELARLKRELGEL